MEDTTKLREINLSQLLRLSIDDLSYDDILAFLQTNETEGVSLDYKKDINAKSLRKHFAAFSNKHGGIILIGVDEDKPFGEQTGGKFTKKDVESINQIASETDPLPVYQIKLFEKDENCFILIKIAQGLLTPYFVINDPLVYVRTGDITKRYIETANQEELKSLFNRKIIIQEGRNNIRSFVKNVFDSHLEQGEQERLQRIESGKSTIDFKLGTYCVYVESLITPAIEENKELISPYLLKDFLTMEPLHWSHSRIPPSDMRLNSIPGGLSGFQWGNITGGIENFQCYCNGSVYYLSDILDSNKGDDQWILLSRVWFSAVLSLKFASKLYHKVGYIGPLYCEIHLNNIKGVLIKGIGYSMDGNKPALLNEYVIKFDSDTNVLDSGALEYELFKKLMWHFGFDSNNTEVIYQDFRKGNSI